MYEVCCRTAAGQNDSDYTKLEKLTVESAVTARAPKIAVITSNRLGWSDLGKWNIIAKMLPPDKNGNVTKGKVVLIDTKNCLIHGPENKLVAAVGLDDMIVVLTEDALLVSSKEKSAETKKIVEKLEKMRLKKYL
jgi:mannose-1-phosphate guanylyltransferase